MSQMRVLLGELRAGFSAAMVCALILGLVFANFAEAASAKAPQHSAKTGGYALCVEHLTHTGAKHAAPISGDEHSKPHKCPGCCLAAALASALVPERPAQTTRPASEHWVVMAYFDASAREPKSLKFRAANGARAPPA